MKEFFNIITKWLMFVAAEAFTLIAAITLPIWIWSETAYRIVIKMMNRIHEEIGSW